MKKLIPIVIIGMMVLSGLGAVAIQDIQEQDEISTLVKSDVMNIAAPTILETDGYVSLDVQDSKPMMIAGKPMVPVFINTFSFPIGTTIEETTLNINYQTVQLDSKIVPAPAAVPYSSDVVYQLDSQDEFDESVYASSALYPTEPYEIRYFTGIDDGEQVLYVNIRCYAQYSPANDYINVPSTIEYAITYTEPETSLFASQAEYDFLIITNEIFLDEIIRLRDHKVNTMGISTKVVTVDEIVESEPELVLGDNVWTAVSGEDWERVKLFMANERLNGVQYMLLAGGKKGQTNDFWVPGFYSNNQDQAVDGDGVPYDPYYLTDVYFADLFETDQYGLPYFSTWDTNKDGVYAVGPYHPDYPADYDKHIDFVPDVYFGRLPIRYSWDAKTTVDKIIEYETTQLNNPWRTRAIALGGDTSPQGRYGNIADEGVYESEITTGISMDYFDSIGWDTYRMFMSPVGHPRYQGDHQLNNGEEGSAADEVAEELSTRGANWVHGAGHANPAVLGNHPNDEAGFIYYFTIMDMNLFISDGKYPFMVLDGCTNAFWDGSLQRFIDGGINFPGQRGLKWVPTDITSWMVLKENGGGIGAVGNTALGYGYLNEYCTQGLGGWIMPRFAHAFVIQGKERIGEIWAQGITDYIAREDLWNPGRSPAIERKTVEERQIFGDPTIRIGDSGGTFNGEVDETTDKSPYVPAATVNAPTWNVGDKWSYNLNNIDFNMNEVENRGVDLKLSTGTVVFEIVESRAFTYVTKLSADTIKVDIELIFDSYNDEDPLFLELPPMSFENAQLDGTIVWSKDTFAVNDMQLSIVIDIMENLENNKALLEDFGVVLPSFAYTLAQYISIPVQIDVSIDFENPWPIFQFPLEEGKEWGLPEGFATITIGGSVESIWLRILEIVNRFVPIVPEPFAKYLPNVDIAEVLEDFGIPSVMEIEIPYVPEVMRKAPFAVSGQETVSVGAGQYTATRILILGGVGNLYYSDQANNFVLVDGPLNDFLPAMSNINLELIE